MCSFILRIIVLMIVWCGHVPITHAQGQDPAQAMSIITGLIELSKARLFSDLQLAYAIEVSTTTTSGSSSLTLSTSSGLISTSQYGLSLAGFDVRTATVDNIQKAMNQQSADFGVVDIPMSQALAHLSPNLISAPLLLTPVAIAYHIDSLNSGAPPLILDMLTVARIFRGNISYWNDPAIVATNPGVTLPNQTITIFIQGGLTAGTEVLTRTFAAIDPDWMRITRTSPGLTGLNFPDDVKAQFGSRYQVVQGITSSATNIAVLNAMVKTPYSMTYSNLPVCKDKAVPVASILNHEGVVVAPTPSSASLTALELGATLNFQDLTDDIDLSNPQGGRSWPFVVITSVILDVFKTRTTCDAKAEMLRFILWILQSEVASGLASSRSYSSLPPLFQTQANLVTRIQDIVKCDSGVAALSSSTVVTGVLGTTPALQTLVTLYTNVQNRNTAMGAHLTYNLVSATATGTIQQVTTAELDGGFISPELVAAHQTYGHLIQDIQGKLLILPAFITAIVPAIVLDPQIVSATGYGIIDPLYPIILDMEVLGAIVMGDISTWTDPRIREFNPGLWQRYNATGLNPNITLIACCSQPTDAAITIRAMQSLNTTRAFIGRTVPYPFPLKSFLSSRTPSSVIAAEYEQQMDSLASDYGGTLSFQLVSSFVMDTTTHVKLLPRSLSDIKGKTRQQYETMSLYPSHNSLLDCVMDVYDPDTLSMPVLQSRNDGCWPMSNTASAVIPAYYSGDACPKGNQTLGLFQWLLATPSLTQSSTTCGVARATDVPLVYNSVIATLQNIRCDGETMLITLPIIWNLTKGIQSFGYAAAAIGWIIIAFLYAFMFYHRSTTVFRSASVPSMSLILSGIAFILSACIALVSTPTLTSCSMILWLGSLGFTLTFAPLFMKTWRIYKIFDRKALHVIKISNKKLNAMIGGLLAFDVLILIIWQSVAPIVPVLIEQSENNRIHQSTQCQAPSSAIPFIIISLVTKALLIVFGALMGFTTRKVATTFNESQTVAWAIYNFIFAVGIIVPIMVFVNAHEDSYILLQLFLALWVAYASLGLLFGPKVAHIVYGDEAVLHAEQSSSRVSSNGFSFISAAGLPRQILAKYIQALEIQLHAAKARMVELVGTKGAGTGTGSLISHAPASVMGDNPSAIGTWGTNNPTPSTAGVNIEKTTLIKKSVAEKYASSSMTSPQRNLGTRRPSTSQSFVSTSAVNTPIMSSHATTPFTKSNKVMPDMALTTATPVAAATTSSAANATATATSAAVTSSPKTSKGAVSNGSHSSSSSANNSSSPKDKSAREIHVNTAAPVLRQRTSLGASPVASSMATSGSGSGSMPTTGANTPTIAAVTSPNHRRASSPTLHQVAPNT